MLSSLKHRLLVLIIPILFVSCNKKSNQNPIPSVPFDITININLPSYSSLTGVGGWCYVNGGVKGIVVYRRSQMDFVAFERQSPQDPNGTCKKPLTSDPNNFLVLSDSCSGATFSLNDGSPMSGSNIGLRQYATSFDGSSNLRIYNN
jgi:hypothetical protein